MTFDSSVLYHPKPIHPIKNMGGKAMVAAGVGRFVFPESPGGLRHFPEEAFDVFDDSKRRKSPMKALEGETSFHFASSRKWGQSAIRSGPKSFNRICHSSGRLSKVAVPQKKA